MEPIMYSSGVARTFDGGAQSSLFDGTPSASDLMGGNSLDAAVPGGVPGGAATTPYDGAAADDERAPLSMRPKRAGRKLDTKEPESKRRAQNRAAQRAFRERKERHLQELEMRIAELEQESASWRNSSLMLRSKVTELENELGSSGTRTPQGSAQTPGPGLPQHAAQHSPGNLQGQMGLGPNIHNGNGAPNGLQGSPNGAPNGIPNGRPQHLPGHPAQPQQAPAHFPQPNGIHNGYSHGPASSISPSIGPSPPHRNSSVDSLFFDSRSEADTGETPRSSVAGSTSGTSPSERNGSGLTPAQAALSGNPSPNEFCDELSLACVVPKRSGLSTPPVRAQQPAPAQGGGPQGGPQGAPPQRPPQAAPSLVPSDQSVIDFSFANADKEPFDVFQFVNNENSMFDPFDFDAVWDDPNYESLAPDIFASNQPGQFGAMGALGGVAGSAPSLASGSTGSTSGQAAPAQIPPSGVAATSAAPAVTAQAAAQPPSDIIPATTEKYISCTEVWDRICSRPRFGEIDIQGMCSELRAKAKCSDQGVVLPERELEKFLNSYN